MDKAIRDKWAAKLESGEYEQTTGALRLNDAYCCLGVLCEVFREETGEGRWAPTDGGEFAFFARGTGSSDLLPVAVRDWAGLASSNPRLKPALARAYDAAYLNDHVLDFAGIAALVRQLPVDVKD